MPDIPTYPEFIQLLDDDIVLLTALILTVNPKCRTNDYNVFISQLTLSLYLMTQCQLKLRHSMTSLAQTLDYIKVAQRRCPAQCTLDHLTLKLTKRKVLSYDLTLKPVLIGLAVLTRVKRYLFLDNDAT